MIIKLDFTGLNSCKATGLDGLPAKFIIDSAESIVKPLTYIVNLSIESGVFPDDLKRAKIVPIYKKKAKTEPGNYRPVSVLSIMSKVMERVICEQLNDFIEKHDYLYELQSGFRSSYSTDSCLIHLSDHILKQQDKGQYTGMVILDLQKAFDTVNHKILTSKLRAMGVSQAAVNWFISYLGGRVQAVEISGVFSEFRSVTCGVPQGSTLGPLLFLIYVNDMKAAVKCKLLLYADDSALLASSSDVSEIEDVLSRELESVSEWLVENRLSLHLGKTESILFGSNKRLAKRRELHITCNGNDIESGAKVTYLGVTLDQNLSGSSMITKIVSKCNNKIKFLYRNAKNLDKKTKMLLTSALVQCHFDYGCSMWYTGTTCLLKKKLQITQNKVIRFILGLPSRSHIGRVEFSGANMLPVPLRVDQLKLNHMYSIINGIAPSYLKSEIAITGHHGHVTRSGNRACFVPRVNSFAIKSFFYTGIKQWNALPSATQLLSNKQAFKSEVKKLLWMKLFQLDEEIYLFY